MPTPGVNQHAQSRSVGQDKAKTAFAGRGAQQALGEDFTMFTHQGVLHCRWMIAVASSGEVFGNGEPVPDKKTLSPSSVHVEAETNSQ